MRVATALLLGFIAIEAALPQSGRCQPGAAVFHGRCAKCHGESGRADTALGRTLKVAPLVNDRRLARMTTAEMIARIKSDPRHRGAIDVRDRDLKAAALFVKRLARCAEP